MVTVRVRRDISGGGMVRARVRRAGLELRKVMP